MKTNKYQPRFYRVSDTDLYRARVAIEETDLEILTDKPVDTKFVQEKIKIYRQIIWEYISQNKKFLTSLKPVAVELKAKPIIKKMAKAAELAGVGPMAAVAGAIAETLGKDLIRKGYREIIIENGGDIFLKINKKRKVGIYSGKRKLWQDLSIEINPQGVPLGICTSSGTIGHSLSFGQAESAVILAQNSFLADAAATATCNRVKTKQDLTKAMDFARSIKGVSGAVIIYKNNLASFGKNFKFVR